MKHKGNTFRIMNERPSDNRRNMNENKIINVRRDIKRLTDAEINPSEAKC